MRKTLKISTSTTGSLFVYYQSIKRKLNRMLILRKDFYYESIKRKLSKRLILECRCDARLKAKDEGSTRLAYTGWRGEL